MTEAEKTKRAVGEYPPLPEPDHNVYAWFGDAGIPAWGEMKMRAYADATYTLRAARVSPAQAEPEYVKFVCVDCTGCPKCRTYAAPSPEKTARMMPIYVASRASLEARPAMWRELRAQGWPINSTWIDESGPEETKSFPNLWTRIQAEVTAACGVIFYAEPDDFPLKGAYIEVGMALGQGKPVAVVLPGVKIELLHVRPVGSWVRHPLVKICETLEEARDYVNAGCRIPADGKLGEGA